MKQKTLSLLFVILIFASGVSFGFATGGASDQTVSKPRKSIRPFVGGADDGVGIRHAAPRKRKIVGKKVSSSKNKRKQAVIRNRAVAITPDNDLNEARHKLKKSKPKK